MRPILFTILLFTFFSSYGQDKLTGNWYMLSTDELKVVQYNFSDSTFVGNQLDWKLQNQSATQTIRIIKTIQRRGNLYYLFQGISDTSVALLSISSAAPNKSFLLDITSLNPGFKSLADAMAFIEVDTFSRLSLFFYSQKEFDRVKSLADASTITKEDYKKYRQLVIEELTKFKIYASKHNAAFMFFTIYWKNQARKALANLGYNPVMDDEQLEHLNEKFKDDPTLKDSIGNALKLQ